MQFAYAVWVAQTARDKHTRCEFQLQSFNTAHV